MAGIPVVQYNASRAVRGAVNPRWWEEDDPSGAVLEVSGKIERDQSMRRMRDLLHASLFANQPLDSLYQMGVMKTPAGWWDPLGLGHKLTWNIVQVIIETAAAKISKNRPRVMFLTSGGNYSMQRRAKGLSKFVDGIFDAGRIYEEGQRCFVDGCVFDAGIMKVYADGSEIKYQRVLPAEILVDDTEAIYGKPRSMYQNVFAHRDLLIEAFGSKKTEDGRRLIDKIKEAPGVDPSNQYGAGDMIRTVEAWHLPAGDDHPGRHPIVIDGATLFSEKWTKDYFPFPWFKWGDRLVGMWGQGLAERLVGIQLEITKLLRRIQESIHKMAVPRIYYEKGSEVSKTKFTNEVGVFVPYVGRPPEERIAPAMSPEVYQHLERLYAKGFEIARLSQLSAIGQKPAGLDAAVALREFHDIENEGFVVVGQRYEQFYQDAARMTVDMARDLYENREHRVKAPGTRLLEEIAWRDVNMPEDKYVLRSFPVSLLPTTPAGRLQKVQEMLNGGLIDREMALSLLDFPDLEGAVSLHTSAVDDIKRVIENIVEHGEYETPEPAQNLPLMLKMAQSAYLKARNDNVPDKRLDLLLRLMSETQETITDLGPNQVPTLAAPPPPEGMPPEGMPPGAMAPPPDAMAPAPVVAPPVV